jgi:uncharacterized protein (DUF342 family)
MKLPQEIYVSEYIKITRDENDFFIETFKEGAKLPEVDKIISQYPFIHITSFSVLKNTIQNAPSGPSKFGESKERIAVEISPDKMKAYITLCLEDSEISNLNSKEFITEIIQKLKEHDVLFGIKQELLLSGVPNNEKILIAEGQPVVNGTDSIITLYQIRDSKPQIKEEESINFYDLNLINKVKAGDWLGERIEAQKGTPGKTVLGTPILPMEGKTYPLYYDKLTVEEVQEGGKTILRSKKNGAVYYLDKKVCISNHLEISGDVGFSTGNIDFDGNITINGIVCDNFSVVATKDIEILGSMGIGAVKEIISRQGSIYLKGGIAGKNRAVIKAQKDVFAKFVSEAVIESGEIVNIGFYSMNSNINAKEVVIESFDGQIIGGNIKAEAKIVSPIVGSTNEKRTQMLVTGFDRNVLKERSENIGNILEDLKNKLFKLKQELSIYESLPHSQLTPDKETKLRAIADAFKKTKDAIESLSQERILIARFLATHGEGEVAILKRVYPNTILEIKDKTKEIDKIIMAPTFYYLDGELREL